MLKQTIRAERTGRSAKRAELGDSQLQGPVVWAGGEGLLHLQARVEEVEVDVLGALQPLAYALEPLGSPCVDVDGGEHVEPRTAPDVVEAGGHELHPHRDDPELVGLGIHRIL